ncbi:MAG: BPL-N domain-containing protein [Verrucomicrobiota bacterium]
MMRHLLLCLLSSTLLARGETLYIPVIDGEWSPMASHGTAQALVKEEDHKWPFTPDEKLDASDPFAIKIGSVNYVYYSAKKPLTTTLKGKSTTRHVGAVYARTSFDGRTWGKPAEVAWGGHSGEDVDSAGHPCVVEVKPGLFYLFRTQTEKGKAATSVYCSQDPLDFGLFGNYADAQHYVTALPVLIEQVVHRGDEWFAVNAGKVARLKWTDPPLPKRPTIRAPGIKIRVALYDDSGSAGQGVPKVSEQLGKCSDIEVIKLNRDGIRAGLDGYDVVIFTGGTSGRQANTIGVVGREQVRRFIKAGGGYVGICAGAYLACDGFSWGLKILDAKTPSPKWERGIAELKIESTDDGQKLLGLPAETMVKYHNGPLLVPANNPAIPDFEPLTFFRTEIAKNGSPPDIMVNTPAVVQGQFGAGRVIVCSPHPEQSTGLDRWIEHAVRAVAASPDHLP